MFFVSHFTKTLLVTLPASWAVTPPLTISTLTIPTLDKSNHPLLQVLLLSNACERPSCCHPYVLETSTLIPWTSLVWFHNDSFKLYHPPQSLYPITTSRFHPLICSRCLGFLFLEKNIGRAVANYPEVSWSLNDMHWETEGNLDKCSASQREDKTSHSRGCEPSGSQRVFPCKTFWGWGSWFA